MSEFPRPIPVPRRNDERDDRLDSWKEIAGYLGREVRTVQGWEKNEALPIHRHQHARLGSVYAFKKELDAWRESRKSVVEAPVPVGEQIPQVARPRFSIALIAGACVILLVVLGFVFWKSQNAKGTSSASVPSSVVVLPFLDLSPNKDQDYFSDGLTEEIIDALSRVPNLRVVARTSAFAFKGKANDIRQIGQQLNVNTVLEGSVRKAGDQLRITAQLNRVSDGTHLWSRTFDRQFQDIFAVQREISEAIAGQLRAGQVPQREPTTNLEAYRLYQEGRYFFNQHLPPDSYRKAIERYQQAIDRDPKFALAYSGLADAYAYLSESMVVYPKEAMPKAKEAAERAVALDDSLGEAHTSLGIVKLDYEWDRDGAQREFLRAMQLNPGSGYLHHWYAHSLEAQNRLPEATKEMRIAHDLDPLSVVMYWDIGNELIWAGKFDEALDHLKKATELFPNQPILLIEQAEAHYGKHDLAAEQRDLNSLKAVFSAMPEMPAVFLGYIGAGEAHQGHISKARQVLDQLEALRQKEYVEPVLVLDLCVALRDHKQLALWLQRGYEERSALWVYLPLLKSSLAFDAEAEAQLAKYY
jgi:TolB-like protein